MLPTLLNVLKILHRVIFLQFWVQWDSDFAGSIISMQVLAVYFLVYLFVLVKGVHETSFRNDLWSGSERSFCRLTFTVLTRLNVAKSHISVAIRVRVRPRKPPDWNTSMHLCKSCCMLMNPFIQKHLLEAPIWLAGIWLNTWCSDCIQTHFLKFRMNLIDIKYFVILLKH